MMKAGVIGYPIGHSKSPLIHQYWLELYGLQGSYTAIEISKDNLKEKIKDLIDQGFNGFNVTIPHKESIFQLCDQVDDKAKIIGAVNTVIIKDKKLYGTNTDAFGFIENIKLQTKFDFKNKSALVLGAGGASRAILYGLLQENIEKIYLTNRTIEKANLLRELDNQKIIVVDWQQKENYLDKINLLVNTTSLGMIGQDPLDINLQNLNPDCLVTDIVYKPLMTPLLESAKTKQNQIVTGIGMLLHQARPAFKEWTGIMPDVPDELTKRILS